MDIQVFQYRVYDVTKDTFATLMRRATRERISRAHGEIIDGSEAFLDESKVDDEGREILPEDKPK